ncbi:phosphopantetheine-binding protein [Fulvivirga ulvae]|nr:phosphopantetheine-binding protein [Fulvivirga ulvae]UII31876.1 phosphopantetheine-binding protein [Fulvivirga ulvae]
MTEVNPEINNQVVAFISAHTGIDEIDEHENIFESGLVNSLFAIELMTFIEKQFNIKVTIQDLSLDTFSTISKINEFVTAKMTSNV